MWQFAFSVSLEGGEGTEECKAHVEGDQVYSQLHRGATAEQGRSSSGATKGLSFGTKSHTREQ